jgi:predicted GNAT superfamily acetyltransferase
VILRECTSFEDFRACIELERAVWKDDDIDVMPVRLYMLSRTCGSPTIGAFDRSGRLVGFSHTMIALRGTRIAYHSHMLAVAEGLRDMNIGYRIKLAQRRRAIEAGIPLIFWTFDPLQSRNAHLNINKLGAIIRQYKENYYGESASNVFDSQGPSDRLIAEWWVTSDHVASVVSGSRPLVERELASVEIPEDIEAIRSASVQHHRGWRMRAREEFQAALQRGGIVRGFGRRSEDGVSRYIFGDDDPQFSFDAYPAHGADGTHPVATAGTDKAYPVLDADRTCQVATAPGTDEAYPVLDADRTCQVAAVPTTGDVYEVANK